MIKLNPSELTPIPFTQTVPNSSFYRHASWEVGCYKQFRHAHTMTQNLDGFSFWNKVESQALETKGE